MQMTPSLRSSFFTDLWIIQAYEVLKIISDNKNVDTVLAWWLTPLITARDRQSQVDLVSWRSAWSTKRVQDSQSNRETLPQKKKKEKKF